MSWSRRSSAERRSMRPPPLALRRPRLPHIVEEATEMPRAVCLLRLLVPFAIFPLGLGGCAVGPNYSRPPVPNPQQFRFAEGVTQAQSLADLPWWQVFDDLALQALIKEAVANNLDLRIAVARVEEARARAGIAKSFFYPQVDAAANYNIRQAS